MTTRETLNEKLKGAYQRLQSSADDRKVALVRERLRGLAEELVSSDEVTDDLTRRINKTVAEANAIYVFNEENNSSSAESSQQPELKSESKESEPVVEQPAQQAAPVAVQSSEDPDPTLNDVMRGIEELKLALRGGLDHNKDNKRANAHRSRQNNDGNRADNKPVEDRGSDNDRDSFVAKSKQWLNNRRLPARKH